MTCPSASRSVCAFMPVNKIVTVPYRIYPQKCQQVLFNCPVISPFYFESEFLCSPDGLCLIGIWRSRVKVKESHYEFPQVRNMSSLVRGFPTLWFKMISNVFIESVSDNDMLSNLWRIHKIVNLIPHFSVTWPSRAIAARFTTGRPFCLFHKIMAENLAIRLKFCELFLKYSLRNIIIVNNCFFKKVF